MRMDPPKSVPHSNAAIPDATAAAPPPVLPPDVRDGSWGLFVRPMMWFSLSAENAMSPMFDFPSRTAPARRSAVYGGADSVGTRAR
jgi:hypothetical protein